MLRHAAKKKRTQKLKVRIQNATRWIDKRCWIMDTGCMLLVSCFETLHVVNC
jgi:hypothetical protein